MRDERGSDGRWRAAKRLADERVKKLEWQVKFLARVAVASPMNLSTEEDLIQKSQDFAESKLEEAEGNEQKD